MKCNYKSALTSKDRQNIIRQTLKQVIIALNQTEGVNLGKQRIQRVIDTWCDVVDTCENDSDTMLIIDKRLQELGIDFLDKEEFIITKIKGA